MKARKLRKRRIERRGKLIFAACFAFVFLGLFAAAERFIGMGKEVYLIYLTTAVMVVLIIIVICLDNPRIESISKKIERRSGVCTLLSTVLLGFLITALLTSQNNQILQKQVDIANRETSPSITIETVEEGGAKTYIVTNEKGIASYLSMSVSESYHFSYNGKAYEANLALPQDNTYDVISLGGDETVASFRLEDINFDRDKAYEIFQTYLESKTGIQGRSSNERKIKLSFFDYKNQNHQFEYGEYRGSIRLNSTTPSNYYSGRNLTTYLFQGRELESTIKGLVDDLLSNSYE